VLTRLHHVPNWRELKSNFVGPRAREVLEGHAAGYDMLIEGTLPHRMGHPPAHDRVP
jgi:hypothetical protein